MAPHLMRLRWSSGLGGSVVFGWPVADPGVAHAKGGTCR
jgi:hypothetical protein